MNNAAASNLNGNVTGTVSMRRTILTLLGAVAAFGVLTASYATADLPPEAPAATIVTTAG